jgi:hypothetical protein
MAMAVLAGTQKVATLEQASLVLAVVVLGMVLAVAVAVLQLQV